MKNIKRFLILCLTCMASFCLLIGVSITNAVSPVNAESGIVRQDGLVVDGLSVRIGTASDSREGVRFHIGMSLELYDSLLNDEKTGFKDGVTTGTLIIGTSKKSGDLTVDTQGASNADTTNNWFAIEDEQGNVSMQSVVYVYNIPASQYGTNLSVVGYVNNNGTITYSDEVSRSMSWVAEKEFNDPNSTFDQDMKDKLQSAYLNKTVTLYDGTTEEIKTVTYGNTLSVEDPTKNGYTFNGWYNQAGTHEWDMATKVTNPIKLYANWIRNAGYEILDDFYGDLDNYEFYHTTGSKVGEYTASYNGGLYLDYTNAKNQNDIIHFTHITSEKYNHFDYITITGNVNVNRNGFRISLWGNDEYLNTVLADIKGNFTYVIKKDDFSKLGNYLKIHTGNYTGTVDSEKAKSLTIYSIVGGYNSVNAETKLNLVEKTGFTASELSGSYFENASGAQTPISDVTNFTATERGKIVLTLNVKGYATSNVEIVVNSISEYNALDNFTGDIGVNYLITQRDTPTTIYPYASLSYTDGGVKLDTTSMQQGNFLFNFKNVTKDKYSKFDYITITGNVECTRNGFTITIRQGNNNANEKANIRGDFTYVIPKEYFTSDCFPNDYLRLHISLWTGTGSDKVKSMTIYSITGGYNSVYTEEEINFEEKFGATASELEGSYFENASGVQTPITNFNEYTPTEAGKLVVIVNAEGYKQTTYEIEVVKVYNYNELETFSGELSESYLVANRDYPNDAYPYAVLSYENGGVKLNTTSMVQGNFLYNFKNVTADKYNKFDYITITGNVECTRNGFSLSVRQGSSNVNAKENIKGDFTYVIPKEYFTTTCFPNNYLRIQIQLWTGTGSDKAKSMTIYSITGGYNAVETEEIINLVEKTGLTANELAGTYFENENGKQTTISNLTNFTATEGGKIVLVINKVGYKATNMEIEVIDLPKYNNLETFSGDMSNYSIYSKLDNSVKTATLTSMTGSQTGISALSSYGGLLKAEFDYKNGYGVYMSIGFNNITSAVLANFDYVTISVYLDSTANVQIVPILDDNNNRGTAIAEVKGLYTYTFNTSEIATSCLRLGYRDYTGSGSTKLKAIYILGITGGYNDVAVGESINLVEKTGLTASELTGTYFENASGVQTVIEDVTAFLPSEEGKIVVKVIKQGYKATEMTINVVSATE